MVYVISSSLVLIPFMQFKLLISMASINYASLLTKLKADLPESEPEPKKRRRSSTSYFYPTEAQNHMLDICGYKDFTNPPIFDTIKKKPTHLSLNIQTTRKHLRTNMAQSHVQVNTPSSVSISNYLHHDPHSTNDLLAS
jgi:hypothetical protein